MACSPNGEKGAFCFSGYTYDDASQMTLLRNAQNDLTTFEYDDAGRRTVVRRPASRTSMIYDDASQMTDVIQRNSGGDHHELPVHVQRGGEPHRGLACNVTLWDLETGELKSGFAGNERGIAEVAISPDGRVLASGGHDFTVRLWDIVSAMPLATFRGQHGVVTSVAISPNGRLIASGSRDGTVRVWEVPPRDGEPAQPAR